MQGEGKALGALDDLVAGMDIRWGSGIRHGEGSEFKGQGAVVVRGESV